MPGPSPFFATIPYGLREDDAFLDLDDDAALMLLMMYLVLWPWGRCYFTERGLVRRSIIRTPEWRRAFAKLVSEGRVILYRTGASTNDELTPDVGIHAAMTLVGYEDFITSRMKERRKTPPCPPMEDGRIIAVSPDGAELEQDDSQTGSLTGVELAPVLANNWQRSGEQLASNPSRACAHKESESERPLTEGLNAHAPARTYAQERLAATDETPFTWGQPVPEPEYEPTKEEVAETERKRAAVRARLLSLAKGEEDPGPLEEPKNEWDEAKDEGLFDVGGNK